MPRSSVRMTCVGSPVGRPSSRRPVIPRCTTRYPPPSSEIRMNLPYRLTPAIRRPWSCDAMLSGSPPRSTRRLRNSAVTIRRPTSGAMERATVSTSGSSGTLRHLEEDVVALDAHFKNGNPLGGAVIVLAGTAVEFPQMIGANHAPIVDLTLPQRAAPMNTNAAESADFAARVADGIGMLVHQHFGHGIRRQGGEMRHFHEWHNSSKPV